MLDRLPLHTPQPLISKQIDVMAWGQQHRWQQHMSPSPMNKKSIRADSTVQGDEDASRPCNKWTTQQVSGLGLPPDSMVLLMWQGASGWETCPAASQEMGVEGMLEMGEEGRQACQAHLRALVPA